MPEMNIVRLKINKTSDLKFNWFTNYEDYVARNIQSFDIDPRLKNSSPPPVLVLCHEFFDAMPIMIFEYSELGWVEKLVDKSPEVDTKNMFQWVNSEPMSKNVTKILNPKETFGQDMRTKEISVGDRIEVAPKSSILMNSFAELIAKTGGAVLAIDYGENHAFSDSLRGIAQHRFVNSEDLLELAGSADLSAYVNFLALKDSATRIQGIAEPTILTQGEFLKSMGLPQRCEYLKMGNPGKAEELDLQVRRLIDSDEMGQVYKFMYVGLESAGDVFPFLSNPEDVVFL